VTTTTAALTPARCRNPAGTAATVTCRPRSALVPGSAGSVHHGTRRRGAGLQRGRPGLPGRVHGAEAGIRETRRSVDRQASARRLTRAASVLTTSVHRGRRTRRGECSRARSGAMSGNVCVAFYCLTSVSPRSARCPGVSSMICHSVSSPVTHGWVPDHFELAFFLIGQAGVGTGGTAQDENVIHPGARGDPGR
jgi:hypothetical protein